MPDDIRARPFGFSPNNIVFLDVETLITFLITLCFLCAMYILCFIPTVTKRKENLGTKCYATRILCGTLMKNIIRNIMCRVVIQCLRRVNCLWFIVSEGMIHTEFMLLVHWMLVITHYVLLSITVLHIKHHIL